MRQDYIGREQCENIKGIFILCVFFSHFMQYVGKMGGAVIDLHLGQMMVTLFLFYSGFGVMESIRVKGDAYVRQMPYKRMLTTFLNFDVAVLAFIVLDLLLGRSLDWSQALLSFIGWDSVGNSNWYIFVILVCYALAWLSSVRARWRPWAGWITLGATAVCWFLLSFVKESYWYDTISCFPVGMLYSRYRVSIERIMERWYFLIIGVVIASFVGISYLSYFCTIRGSVSNLKAIVFALGVVFLTMKIPIRLSALRWCGQKLFPIYIYQRLPMVALFALAPQGFADWRMPLYFVFSLVVTLLITTAYPKWKIVL